MTKDPSTVALLLSVLVAGCASNDQEREVGGTRDLTVEIPELGEDSYEFASPDIEVDPYTEVNLCSFGTYDGPETGVVSLVGFSEPSITHHAGVMGVYDNQFPDEEVVDCMDQGEGGMGTYFPLFFPVGIEMVGGEPFGVDPFGGLDWMDPPEGLAFRMTTGQRWTLDLHYINPEETPAITNTAFQAALVPVEEVEGWMGPVMFDASRIDLPPGDSEITFSCPWESEYDVLSIMAHMHYFGRSFEVEVIRADGHTETIFEIPEWNPLYKDYPRIQPYELGELHVEPGDAFRTTCRWTNDTGKTQPDPAEMCSLEMVVTPLDKPMLCLNGRYE